MQEGEKAELKALENLVARSSDLDQLTSVPPEFNVFEAMGVVFQELRHSDFLAFLLNPQASHGLGDRFTKEWLKRVVSSARDYPYAESDSATSVTRPELLEHLDMSEAQVFRERDHIDVLLVDARNRLTVVVENKMFSGEHSDQLARYRRIVEERYPGFDSLCIFLTPTGEAPSHSGYVPTDYAVVCEEVESIVEEGSLPDGAPIDSEVSFALSHYARMLRRNIVANSEALDLVRRLYLEHREAFDFVYAHRFSHQKRLRRTLIDLIEKTPDLIYRGTARYSTEEWISFYPEAWDVPALRCAREDYGGRDGLILSFVFDNHLDSLDLKLEFGPGDDEVRRRLLKMAHEDPELFTGAPPTPDPEWVTSIWRMPLLTREAYLEGKDSDRERLLREHWNGFLGEAFPQLSSAIKRREWIWNTDAKR